jgi:hypothetical protein
MRERRIILDLDESGDVIAWSATGFLADGSTAWSHVCPFAPPEDSDVIETASNLARMEPDVQLALPVSWERWLDDRLSPEGETPMPARHDSQR